MKLLTEQHLLQIRSLGQPLIRNPFSKDEMEARRPVTSCTWKLVDFIPSLGRQNIPETVLGPTQLWSTLPAPLIGLPLALFLFPWGPTAPPHWSCSHSSAVSTLEAPPPISCPVIIYLRKSVKKQRCDPERRQTFSSVLSWDTHFHQLYFGRKHPWEILLENPQAFFLALSLPDESSLLLPSLSWSFHLWETGKITRTN